MNITNELIEKLVKENIEKEISECEIKEMARDTIRELIVSNLKQITKEKVDMIIEDEIKRVLSGSIDTDNGWGDKKHFDSFEDFFKIEFSKKMENTWEMQRIIQKTVENKLNELFKKKTKEVTTTIQSMVLKEMLKEEK